MAATVTRTEIEDKLLETLAELADCAPADITPDATLGDLDIDSLDLVELGQIVMEEWGVELVHEDLRDVKNVRDALDAVVKKVT